MFGERPHGQGHPFDHRRAVHRHPLRPAAGDAAQPIADDSRAAIVGTRSVKRIMLLVTVGLLAWMLAGRLFAPPSGITSAPSVEQLKPLAALMTHRVVVVDALTVTITGYVGELRAAVIVRGDAMLTVDLAQATIKDIEHEARTVVIVLPPPHVLSARVDHEHTRIFSVEASGLWALMPGVGGRAEIIDRALREAQEVIAKAASEPLVIEQARARAQALICSFFADSMKWSITVRWADEPGER